MTGEYLSLSGELQTGKLHSPFLFVSPCWIKDCKLLRAETPALHPHSSMHSDGTIIITTTTILFLFNLCSILCSLSSISIVLLSEYCTEPIYSKSEICCLSKIKSSPWSSLCSCLRIYCSNPALHSFQFLTWELAPLGTAGHLSK